MTEKKITNTVDATTADINQKAQTPKQGQQVIDYETGQLVSEVDANPLVKIVTNDYTFCRATDNRVYAIDKTGNHYEAGSKEFKDNCTTSFLEKHGRLPSSKDWNLAGVRVRQEALQEVRTVTISYSNHETYGDRACFRQEDGGQIEVSAEGYKQSTAGVSGVLFNNNAGTGYVTPVTKATTIVNILCNFLNMTVEQVTLVAGCLVKAFMPGPNPVLVFIGPQGSGKTFAAKRLKEIIDPDDTNGKIRIMDNISGINGNLSDDLCRLSHETTTIITTINPLMPNEDLVDRTILIECKPISPENRQPEVKMLNEFNKVLPSLMGHIFSALSSVFEHYDEIKLNFYPRLAELSQVVVAACPGLDMEVDNFRETLDRNRIESVERSLNGNPLCTATLDFMDSRKENSWSGTCTEYMEELNKVNDADNRSHSNWPSKPNKMSAGLNRALPFLRTRGIDILWSKSGKRTITIVKMGAEGEDQPASQAELTEFIERPSSDETVCQGDSVRSGVGAEVSAHAVSTSQNVAQLEVASC